MKRIAIGFFAVMLIVSCGPTRPKGIKNFQFRLADLDVVETALTYAKLNLVIDAVNPNGVDVLVDRMEYEIYVNGQNIGSGAASFKEMFAPGESKKLQGKVAVDYISSGLAVLNLIKSDFASYSLNAKVYYETPMGNYHSWQTISHASMSTEPFEFDDHP